MENLPSSRFHLLAMGIDCLESSPPCLKLWNYFIRSISVVILISLLCLQFYGMVAFENVIILNTAHMTVFIFQTLSYVTMFSRTKQLFNIMRMAMQRLDAIALRKIRSFDNRHVTIKFGYISIMIVSLITYFHMNGVMREAAVIGIGFKHEFTEIFLRIIFACMAWTYWLFMLFMQFYVSIMFVSVQVAKGMRQQFVQSGTTDGTPDYDMMRRSLEWYNLMMKTINEEVGIIPFSLLAMEFVGFACAISFMVTGSELGVSLWLAALTTGAANLIFVKSFYQLIELGNESQRSISNAWKIAEESVADPFSLTPDFTSQGLKTRKSLKFFLITESAVPAKAADSIIIDRSLILNFFNQLIPFTVMMFTTLKEFDKKPK